MLYGMESQKEGNSEEDMLLAKAPRPIGAEAIYFETLIWTSCTGGMETE